MKNIKKSILVMIVMVALVLPLLAGCANIKNKETNDKDSDAETKTTTEFSINDLSKKKIGIQTGTPFDKMLLNQIQDVQIEYYNANTDLAAALDAEKIDAYLTDKPMARLMGNRYKNQEIVYQLEDGYYGFVFPKDEAHQNLCNQFNEFVQKSFYDGTMEEIDTIWFSDDESIQKIDLSSLTAENGVLEMGICSDVGAPFGYYSSGKPVGYDVDLAARFCKEYGYGLNVTDYNLAGLIAAATVGKVDMAAASLNITPERQEKALMSNPYYFGGVVVVMDNTKTTEKENFAGKKMGVVSDTVFDSAAKNYFPDAIITYCNSNNDMATALNDGKIDAYLMDEPMARLETKDFENQNISSMVRIDSYAFAFAKDNKRSEKIRLELNEFLEKIKSNGELEEIDSIWFGTDESLKTIPYDKITGGNGTIRLAVATDAGGPFAYSKDGALVGYEIDIIARFCIEKGYNLEVSDNNFSSIFDPIISGQEDMAASAIAINEEREEMVDFSLPSYDGGIVVVTKKEQDFSVQSLSKKKVGIQTGATFDKMLLNKVSDPQIEYYNSNPDLAAALDSKKIDAYLADQPMARLMGAQYKDQEIVYQLEDANYGFMFPKDEKHQTICNQFNEFVKKSFEDGTMDEIDSIWFGSDESLHKVDLSSLTAENGVLEMAISSDVGAPFGYYFNGEPVGYDVDLAARFCKEYGYGLHIADYNLAGLLAAATSGKVDMAACSLMITPERKETALMSNPVYIGGVVIVMNNTKTVIEEKSFFSSIGDSFERTFIRENRWKLFLSGLGITVLITIVSMILGSFGGFGIYLIIRKKNKIFNGIWSAFESIMGKTPVIVILMILYYIIFGRTNFNGVLVSIIGFTVLFICTVTNLLKMGAGAVDHGQEEAALAMGYSERETYFNIVFPQSIKHFLPAYKTEVINLIKATAIVGYIAVQDLTKVGDLIRSRTYEAFFPLIATAIIYYLFALLLTWLIGRINIKIEPRNRDAKKILKGIKPVK